MDQTVCAMMIPTFCIQIDRSSEKTMPLLYNDSVIEATIFYMYTKSSAHLEGPLRCGCKRFFCQELNGLHTGARAV